jgi:hypothetical protein
MISGYGYALPKIKDNPSFILSEECLKTFGTFYPIKYIASGISGAVFQVCDQDDESCKYVVKAQKPKDIKYSEQDIENEIAWAKLAADIEVGPNVINTFSCDGEHHNTYTNEMVSTKIYFIIMDKMDMTLGEYIYKYRHYFNESDWNNIANMLIELQIKLAEKGLLLYDLHIHNVMVNIDSDQDITEMRIIDFQTIKTLGEDAFSYIFSLEELVNALKIQGQRAALNSYIE